MVFPDNLVEKVVTAVLTGGGTAASTILVFFRDVRKRIDELEKKVGSTENRTGIAYKVYLLEEEAVVGVKKLRSEIESWTQHPPDWLINFGRRRSNAPGSLDEFVAMEDRIRQMDRRIRELEETFPHLEERVRRCISEEDFAVADRQRAAEISVVRTTLAEVRGLLQGLQSVLGFPRPNGSEPKKGGP
jgi:hypothetical protein